MNKKSIKIKSIALSLLMIVSLLIPTTMNTGRISASDSTNTDALKLDKKATYNTDGTYTLNLDAYATGNVSVITKTKPTDIVLVLDTSGSMLEGINSGFEYSEINGEHMPPYADGYESGVDVYYILVAGEYKPVTKIETEFQFCSKESIDPIVPSISRYKVHAYIGEDNVIYQPARSDGTALAEHFENGGADDHERFKNYQVARFYEQRDMSYGDKKIDVLKNSVNKFIDSAKETDGDHRFSIVTYDDGSRVNTDFLSVKTDANRLKSIVSNLSAGGATASDLGMKSANEVIAGDDLINNPERGKAVVMFTDGEPMFANKTPTDVANGAIAEARIMKDKGFTVYTAGIASKLNNQLDPVASEIGLINTYMQYVSSNYPKATSLTNWGGEGSYNNGKYLFATDKDSFEDMFNKISEDIITTSSTLDDKTELVDVISDYFDIRNKDNIKTYTQNYLGNGNWSEKVALATDVELDKDSKTITVTGFSYKDNPVVENGAQSSGKRLCVEVNVKAKEGFIGGNNIDTNKATSGIYYENTFIKAFPQPKTNVALNFDMKLNDTSVYQTQSVKSAESSLDADTSMPGIQYVYDTNKIATLDGINNKFVTIQYEFFDEKNVSIAKANVNAGETTLRWEVPLDKSFNDSKEVRVKASVNPIETSTATDIVAVPIDKTKSFRVNVFKPITNVKNNVAFAGEYVNLNTAVKSIEWICDRNESAKKPIGDAPKTSYTFNENGLQADGMKYLAKKDTKFVMDVYIGDKKVTENTSFKNSKPVNNATFSLQVISGEVNITKKIDKAYTENKDIHANQTFIFKITVKDPETKQVKETYYQSIDFDQNDMDNGTYEKSIKLTGLKRGIYTITEENSWSWKYDFANSTTNYKNQIDTLFIGEKNENQEYFGVSTGTTVNGDDVSYPGAITITNTLKKSINILGDNANAINRFVK